MGGDSERTIKCFTCQKYFAHKRSLDRHIDVEHKDEQRFVCQYCSRAYNRKDNLTAHCRDRHPEKSQNRERSQSRGRYLERQSKSDHRRRSRSPSRSPLPNRREEKKRKDRKKQVVQAKLERDELPQDPLQVVVSPRTREEVEGRKGSRSRRLSGKPLAMMRQQQLTSSESEESAVADVASPEDGCGGTAVDVRSVQIGRPIPPLDVKRLLRNQRVEVDEFSSQTSYNGAEKVFQETRERKYGAIFLRNSADVSQKEEGGGTTKVRSVQAGVVGVHMSDEQFSRAILGRIQSVTQTTTRQIFQGGILVSKEESRKEFHVDIIAGFDDSTQSVQ